jgi:hypothetical protein
MGIPIRKARQGILPDLTHRLIERTVGTGRLNRLTPEMKWQKSPP